jgi:hypothetical protein
MKNRRADVSRLKDCNWNLAGPRRIDANDSPHKKDEALRSGSCSGNAL